MSMLFYYQPRTEWETLDYKLLEAFQILEDETCSQCGHPIWLCRWDGPEVAFRVKSMVCKATRAQEEHRHRGDKSVSKADKAEWGKSTYTEPYATPRATVEGELPSRSDFYKGLENSGK